MDGGATMDKRERDRKAYALARHFFLARREEGITPEILDSYLELSTRKARPAALPGIYERILESAQNASMKAGVIGRALGGVERLGEVLCEFDAAGVLTKFQDWEPILDEIVLKLEPRGEIRRNRRSIWPAYCRTIRSAAKFITQFSDADDFYSMVEVFDRDDRIRQALPMLLDAEIDGLGFATACDFLKEMGYVKFGKPDVHLRDIFEGLGLCAAGASEYQLLNSIIRVADSAGVSPYSVDKVFWLIGSGYFYKNPEIGRRGRVGGRKKEFITSARLALEAAS